MEHQDYENSVFINCPFDHDYRLLFNAIIFAVCDCGFIPRCAQEIHDSSQIRLEKIMDLIEQCKFGFHDLSRTELNADRLPRFNMPLELGIFLGAKRYGESHHQRKRALVVDSHKYRYQKSTSDIAGNDISAHNGNAAEIIGQIRNWLNGSVNDRFIPGATEINARYARFSEELPELREKLRLTAADITYVDYVKIVGVWLKNNDD